MVSDAETNRFGFGSSFEDLRTFQRKVFNQDHTIGVGEKIFGAP